MGAVVGKDDRMGWFGLMNEVYYIKVKIYN